MLYHESGSWFAVQVASRAERKVADSLACKGYECFLPLYKAKRKWSDRNKVLQLPMFPGYVFCRIFEARTGLVLATPGAVRVVGFGGKPYPVSESEISALQQVVRSGVDASPFMPFLKVGQKVEIKDGPLSGISGIIIHTKNRRLVLSVELLMRSISIDVDAYEVTHSGSEKLIDAPMSTNLQHRMCAQRFAG